MTDPQPGPFIPYRDALQWRVHDAYYSQLDATSWRDAEVPSVATNSTPFARQTAAFLVAHVRRLEQRGLLEEGEPVCVLEVGGGRGTFAARLLRALDDGLDEEGRRLAGRLRYFLSDYSAAVMRGAAAGAELAGLVAAGRLVPALFDVRDPTSFTALDGATLQARPVAVLANYLCCTLPHQPLQRRGDGLDELGVATHVEAGVVEEWLRDATRAGLQERLGGARQWRSLPPEAEFPGPVHRAILDDLFQDLDGGCVAYPHKFLDFVLQLDGTLAPGGVVLVADYGFVDDRGLLRGADALAQRYGNSINHAVHFPIFDAFARATGWRAMRTRDPLASVHRAALGRGTEIGDDDERLFDEILGHGGEAQELIDVTAAARLALDRGDVDLATRLLRRARALDPHDALLHLLLGSACVDGGNADLALDYLGRGEALDPSRSLDFDFQIGRAHTARRAWPAAVEAYLRSLAREEHPVTYTNLGAAYEQSGDLASARACFDAALRLDPTHERARLHLTTIRP